MKLYNKVDKPALITVALIIGATQLLRTVVDGVDMPLFFVIPDLLYWLSSLSLVVFATVALVFLPLAIPRATRAFSAVALTISSYVFGLILWIWSFQLALSIWGIWAANIGVALAGVGVIPVAMLATLVNALWLDLIELGLLTVLIVACRWGAAYLANTLDRNAKVAEPPTRRQIARRRYLFCAIAGIVALAGQTAVDVVQNTAGSAAGRVLGLAGGVGVAGASYYFARRLNRSRASSCLLAGIALLSTAFVNVLLLMFMLRETRKRDNQEEAEDASVASRGNQLVASTDDLPRRRILASEARVERQALEALYHSTDGPNWPNKSGWLRRSNVAAWYGVSCRDGHVIGLDLRFNNLRGALPSELGYLSELESLYLVANQLSGSIPAELGNLGNLKSLGLSSNRLSGPIPPELGNLGNLHTLDLLTNQLSGPIPSALGNLRSLTWLSLAENHLSGPIPAELGRLSNLNTLWLWTNQLSGPIPPALGNLSKLKELALSSNQLSGSIPIELSSLLNLKRLSLDDNQLSGAILEAMGDLSELNHLGLSSNHLCGPIPPAIGNLRSLEHLNLRRNTLSGPIPPELGNLRNLKSLNLDDNQLSGPIPAELSRLRLDFFWFHGTELCEPGDADFQAWLSSIALLQRTGRPCE